jgi:parvulin-like peptidyl-prolyl isomerase
VLSILALNRRPSAADTAETLAKVKALREEITRGAKFEDVAKRESDDSTSAVKGGDLGRTVKGAFVKPFDDAIYSLPIGVLSQPIKTEFGYHLLRVDKRTADTAFVHHVLKLVKQGDSAATRTDRQADQIAKTAAGATTPASFDEAAKQLNLLVSRITADEGQPASYLGKQVPSASAWAFSGVRPGEISDLFDDDAAYYLVRLDSIHDGGEPPFDEVKEQVRDAVAKVKALDAALPRARELAKAAAGSTLEAAAKTIGRPVVKEGPIARNSQVAAFGFVSEATGAAFALPVGAVSEPIRTDDALFVMRVDKRVQTDTTKWTTQKAIQRQQVTNSLRDQRLRLYLANLRKEAKVEDRRKELNALQRRQAI